LPLEARVLKLAWWLETLFQKHGYAFAANAHFAGTTSMPIGSVERAFTALEDAKAIIRVHVFTAKGGVERRVFPATGILSVLPAKTAGSRKNIAPAKSAGTGTRQDERKLPANLAGQNRKEGSYNLTATQIASRRQTEINEQREAERAGLVHDARAPKGAPP
jgi:hypothetical protein